MSRNSNEIANKSDLPSWFDLRKYTGLEKLDAAGWYEQLTMRSDICTGLQRSQHIGRAVPSERFRAALVSLREVPIGDTKNDADLLAYFGDSLAISIDRGWNENLYAKSVHTMTLRDYLTIEGGLKRERLQYARNWSSEDLDCERDRSQPPAHPYESWIDLPILDSTEHKKYLPKAAIVNLGLPDAVLLDGFQQWLANVRKNTDNYVDKKIFKQNDFNKWISFGVLPCLDLRLWALEAGVNIPNRVMADAIFSPGERGEETVRKTTIPYADSILFESKGESVPLLHALWHQARRQVVVNM